MCSSTSATRAKALSRSKNGPTPTSRRSRAKKSTSCLEEVEDDFGLILLSKRKADRMREWEKVIKSHKEGDVVKGKVVRKIKGGLLVNIGVNVFLPASQVDIRRPPDIGMYIDREIECVILKIDEQRRNIVVSRRKLIEDKREKMKQALLSEIAPRQLRKGTVKNIADFGAFVDLGGIDGLLHITDMSWGRISHPSELVKIDDEIEVMILNVDRDKEKIALGLKQKFPSPWELVNEKYPVGTKVKGEVVNVMSYGAFVKLEDGIEGLVHISEMSWTKRINHPSELVNIGDEVEVVVLGINQDKQEISLGMKQTQPNPWEKVAEKYPPGSKVQGTVRNLTNYGAFIELEEGVDGLLHVSDMSWTRKISHANEMLKRGDVIECQVLSVDEDRKRIALGLKQLAGDPWETTIPEKYQPGTVVHRQGHEDHELRRVRRARAGARGAVAHLGTGRPQGRQSGRDRQSRTGDRGPRVARRQRRAQDRSQPRGPVQRVRSLRGEERGGERHGDSPRRTQGRNRQRCGWSSLYDGFGKFGIRERLGRFPSALTNSCPNDRAKLVAIGASDNIVRNFAALRPRPEGRYYCAVCPLEAGICSARCSSGRGLRLPAPINHFGQWASLRLTKSRRPDPDRDRRVPGGRIPSTP